MKPQPQCVPPLHVFSFQPLQRQLILTSWENVYRSRKKGQFDLIFQSFTHHFIKLSSVRNIRFYSSLSPQGPTGRRNLLLKLPSYLTKYHQNISSQIESRSIEVPLYHTPWRTMKQIFHYPDISKVKYILSGKRFTRVLHLLEMKWLSRRRPYEHIDDMRYIRKYLFFFFYQFAAEYLLQKPKKAFWGEIYWTKYRNKNRHLERQIKIAEFITIIDWIYARFTTLTQWSLFNFMNYRRNPAY